MHDVFVVGYLCVIDSLLCVVGSIRVRLIATCASSKVSSGSRNAREARRQLCFVHEVDPVQFTIHVWKSKTEQGQEAAPRNTTLHYSAS